MAVQPSAIQSTDSQGNVQTTTSNGILIDNAGKTWNCLPALQVVDDMRRMLKELQFLYQQQMFLESALNNDPRSYYTLMEIR